MAINGLLSPNIIGSGGYTGPVNPSTRPTGSGHQGGSCQGHHHDSVFLNGNSSTSGAAAIRTLQQDVARRTATDTQVNRMMVTQGIASANADDATKIRDELSKMDPAVLKTLADRGTSIRVLGKDENLFEAGLLRPISQQDFTSNAAADKAGIAAVQNGVSAKYDAQITSAAADLAKLSARADQPGQADQGGGFGSFGGFGAVTPPDPKLNQAQAEVMRLKALKDKEMATGIREASGGRWMEFNFTTLATAQRKYEGMGGDAGMMQMLQMQNDMMSKNASLDQMAAAHGLTDPAQAKAFKDQVYSMNQQRIDPIRQRVTEHLTKTAQGSGPEAEQARKSLAEFRENPGSLPIPIGPDERPLLVPNQFATTVKNGGKDQVANLTIHDVGTYHNWSDKDGKANNPVYLGQYFYENGRSEVLVRREQLGQPASAGFTLTHEMGHAVEEAVKTKNPDFYRSFDGRLRDSHETASPHEKQEPLPGGLNISGLFPNSTASNKPKDPDRRAVSTYAETNSHEFFAEGYAAFIHDPERLKSMDAKLYSLIAEGNKSLGGR